MAVIEDRVQSRKDDSPGQRLRTAELRAELGAIENPEMTNEQVALEWGTFPELVEEVRSRSGWDDYAAEIERYNAQRRTKYEKERAKAFKRLVEVVAPRPSIPERVIAAIWGRR